MVTLRRYRLGRVRDEMAKRSIDACVLVDPVSIRYACDARNMQVFHLRNPARSLVIPVKGPVVLFEFTGCMHLAEGLETVDEIRPSVTASYVAAGDGIADAERAWACQVGDEIRRHCGPAPTVGVERVNAGAAAALADSGFRLVDAQAPLERARAVKSTEEVACIRGSLAATAVGMEVLRDGLAPGRTENEVWSLFHQAVIALGGEYIETRLLASGPRTNPWFQEAGERVIQVGDLVAIDTDTVGCQLLLRLLPYVSRRRGTSNAGTAGTVPDRPGAGRAQYGAAPPGAVFPGLRPGCVEDPGPVCREPLLPVSPRVRYDRGVSVPIPRGRFQCLRLRR